MGSVLGRMGSSVSLRARATSAESSAAATPAGSFRSGTEASAPRLVSTALAGSFVRRLGENDDRGVHSFEKIQILQ